MPRATLREIGRRELPSLEGKAGFLLQLVCRLEMLRPLVDERAVAPDLECLVVAMLHGVGKDLCMRFARAHGAERTGERSAVVKITDLIARHGSSIEWTPCPHAGTVLHRAGIRVERIFCEHAMKYFYAQLSET